MSGPFRGNRTNPTMKDSEGLFVQLKIIDIYVNRIGNYAFLWHSDYMNRLWYPKGVTINQTSKTCKTLCINDFFVLTIDGK